MKIEKTIKIESKHNIGDKVYIILEIETADPVIEIGTIKEIQTQYEFTGSHERFHFSYLVKLARDTSKSTGIWYPENDINTSFEEIKQITALQKL